MLPLFNLSLQLNGYPIKQATAELRKIAAFSSKEYEAFIEQKKKEIVTFHLQKNSFYKELVGTSDYENWSDLPILNKKNLLKIAISIKLQALVVILLFLPKTNTAML